VEASSNKELAKADVENMVLLMLEDDPLAAKLVRLVLQRHMGRRIRLDQESTLEGAIKAAQSYHYDVVLVDLNLPDSEGLQTLERFLDEVPDAAVVVLTGNEDEGEGLRAVQLGAQDYLVKGDYNPRVLMRTLGYAKERHRIMTALRRLSVMDELTKVYNRRGFFSLSRELYDDRMKGLGEPGCVLYFDLDNFKQLNDTHGHDLGDAVLRLFAEALGRSFTGNDVVGRMGGDEFVALALGYSGDRLQQVLERLAASFDDMTADLGVDAAFGFSVGVYCFDAGEGVSLDSAMLEADRDLYRNKRSKKGAPSE